MPQHDEGRATRGGGRGFSMRAEAGRGEILLYDVIDPWYGISAKAFHRDLKALGELSALDVRINSPGGSITEGMAIHSILKRQTAKVTAHVDGVAASMASVVAMAAGEIVMAQGSYMMIHNPLGLIVGEAEEMRELAELLDKMKSQLVNIYAARTKQSADAVSGLMDAETWFTADEAIAAGFADRTGPQLALAALLDPSHYFNLPQKLRGEAQMSDSSTITPIVATPPALPQPAGYADLKAALPGADAVFICCQLEANATVAQAQTAWMAEQNRRLEASARTAVEAQAQAAAAAAARSGVEPLGAGTGAKSAAEADPIVAWNEALAEKIRAGHARSRAVSALVREQPELHAAYIAAYNEAHRRTQR